MASSIFGPPFAQRDSCPIPGPPPTPYDHFLPFFEPPLATFFLPATFVFFLMAFFTAFEIFGAGASMADLLPFAPAGGFFTPPFASFFAMLSDLRWARRACDGGCGAAEVRARVRRRARRKGGGAARRRPTCFACWRETAARAHVWLQRRMQRDAPIAPGAGRRRPRALSIHAHLSAHRAHATDGPLAPPGPAPRAARHTLHTWPHITPASLSNTS